MEDTRQSEASGVSYEAADEISEYSEITPAEDAPPEEAGEKQIPEKEDSKGQLNVSFKKHEAKDESTKILSDDVDLPPVGLFPDQKAEVLPKPFVITPNDSNDPSYTNLVLPYTVVCRLRYHKAAKKINDQFIKELGQHELFQNKALDGVRIHREFCKSIFRNPRKSEMVQITPAQKAKIEAIMNGTY